MLVRDNRDFRVHTSTPDSVSEANVDPIGLFGNHSHWRSFNYAITPSFLDHHRDHELSGVHYENSAITSDEVELAIVGAQRPRKAIVGITGASGVIYGVRLVQELNNAGIETISVLTHAARKVLVEELPLGVEALEKSSRVLSEDEIDADIASGSSKWDAMIIAPCSMKTLSAVAHGYANNLVCRAADVAIKEHRRLVLVVRETPLSAIHISNMLRLSRLGVVILPASPAFYHAPDSVGSMINHVVGKILDCLGVEHGLFRRWRS